LKNIGYTASATTLSNALTSKCMVPTISQQEQQMMKFILEYIEHMDYMKYVGLNESFNLAILNENITALSELIKHYVPSKVIWNAFNFETGMIQYNVLELLNKNVPRDQWCSPLYTKLKPIVSKQAIKHVIVCHSCDEKIFASTFSCDTTRCFQDQQVESQLITIDRSFNSKKRNELIEQLKLDQVDTVTYFISIKERHSIYANIFKVIVELLHNVIQSGIHVAFAFMIPQDYSSNFQEFTTISGTIPANCFLY
jgi:hypothetical protein